MYFLPLLCPINQTFSPSDLVTRSRTTHPIISWIAYMHSIKTLLFFALRKYNGHNTSYTPFTNRENIFPLYHIFIIIP